jgi:hypothetical protein
MVDYAKTGFAPRAAFINLFLMNCRVNLVFRSDSQWALVFSLFLRIQAMWLWILGAATLTASLSLLALFRHRIRRTETLAHLAAQRAEWVLDHPVRIASTADRQILADVFAQERLVRIENFLSPELLEQLRTEAEQNLCHMVRSYIPTHKKGNTLSYESIHRYAHGCLALYHSKEMCEWVSAVTQTDIVPTPDRDQSSLSLLCYKEAGDHIQWHYDYNFYRGRHFTVLLSLANESRAGGLSQSQLIRRTSQGDEPVDTSPNALVIFEGEKVFHKASPTADGDLRMILSMTYCTDPHTNLLKEAARRIKETAFYGLRALWD